MSSFDPAWLALREPYDHAVRDPDLTRAFAAALGQTPRLIDLGCGTGSNLRFLAPHLPREQRWTCVDYDLALLDILATKQPVGIDVARRHLDLAADLERLPVGSGVGITAAALLDLTSKDWLNRFATCSKDCPILLTLSFDGRLVWDPLDDADALMQNAFRQHQGGDKGFGPSLGPEAATYLAERLQAMGQQVRLAPSDWVFEERDRDIQRRMLEGMVGAALEIDPVLPINEWRERRLAMIEAGQSSLIVGHLDLLSLPASCG